MINEQDIVDGITICSGYDPTFTPKANEAVIAAWMQHFGFHPRIGRDEFLAAMTRYWSTPNQKFPQPADISWLASQIRNERSGEQQTSQASYLEAVSDALAAQDVDEPIDEYTRRMTRCIEIIARHRNVTREEARAFVEAKRGRVEDRFRGKVSIDATQRAELHWPASTRNEQMLSTVAREMSGPMQQVYERAMRRAGLVSGDPDAITVRLPVEPDSRSETADAIPAVMTPGNPHSSADGQPGRQHADV